MERDQYLQAVKEHLKSGAASDTVWDEVADHLCAQSECEPLQLDVDLGFAVICLGCNKRTWVVDTEQCEYCGLKVEISKE